MRKTGLPTLEDYAQEYRAEGWREGFAKGMVKGVLSVLGQREVSVSDEVRERISACTDHDQLDRWLDRALLVERAEELFD
ncbi:hypothetical protein [Actinomadura terrae]|uniref:hypothetical protein n=1 Tax=Actinomadura terrae TaxID=604353 RepID=UPI001FA80F24|nr:hypothetical protein [Actinomadura terrae]